MSELIQCEFCDIFVDFNDYLDHSRECSLEFQTPLTASYLTFSYSSYNTNEEDDEDDEDNENDEDDEDDEDNEDNEDDEETASFTFTFNGHIGNQNPLNININSISGILNLQNINVRTIYDLDTYESYSNLEDVKKPVKNIDLVAPLINDEDIPIDNNDDGDNNIICTICQGQVLKIARKTLCNHYFCSKCIEPWLNEMNNTCPNCLCNLDELLKSLN